MHIALLHLLLPMKPRWPAHVCTSSCFLWNKELTVHVNSGVIMKIRKQHRGEDDSEKLNWITDRAWSAEVASCSSSYVHNVLRMIKKKQFATTHPWRALVYREHCRPPRTPFPCLMMGPLFPRVLPWLLPPEWLQWPQSLTLWQLR